MAEYIEREAVEEIMQKHRCSDCTKEKSLDCPLCQLHRPFDEISKIPTSDVYQSEVAREIFAEIEKYVGMIKIDSTNANAIYGANYAINSCVLPIVDELKKKYMEGE